MTSTPRLVSRSSPKAITWQPSQYWDGADGNWSSFNLRVGSPPQIVRVLPSTSGCDTWVVSPEGCVPGELGSGASTCAQSRGGLFNSSLSSTWSDVGIDDMGIEANLGFARDTASYGFDTLGHDLNNDTGGHPLDEQVVGAFTNDDYYLGLFGLRDQPTNFTNYTSPHPSFLQTLKAQKVIPSLSWGYTAGARYNDVFGSLTFGGYDVSRFTYNNSSFPFAQDISRDLVVSVKSIVAQYENGTATTLLPSSSSVLSFIDSTVPYMWLPEEVCENFANTFGLIWNSTTETYFVDDDTHSRLIDANPRITVQMVDWQENGPEVSIEMPYTSFDLAIKYPLVAESTRYFPLAKAANATQYTLGRTFLQEAYIVANYENNTFSVYQAHYQAGVKSKLVSIHAYGRNRDNRSMSTASIIGSIIGSIFFAILVLLILFLVFKRFRKVRKMSVTRDNTEFDRTTSSLTVAHHDHELKELESNDSADIFRELPDSGKAELQDLSSLSGSRLTIGELTQSSYHSPGISYQTHELINQSNPARSEGAPKGGRDNAKKKLEILVATDMLQESSTATKASSPTTELRTNICSTATSTLNLEKSLPPSPVFKTAQMTPIVAILPQRFATTQGIKTDSIVPRSMLAPVVNRVPVATAASLEMEIMVPPGSRLSEAEIVRPLTILKFPSTPQRRANM